MLCDVQTDQKASLVVFDGQDVTNGVWNHQVALAGETQMVPDLSIISTHDCMHVLSSFFRFLLFSLQYYDNGVASKLSWNSGAPSPRPLTWWRLDFPVIDTSSQASWAIDLSAMGKGASLSMCLVCLLWLFALNQAIHAEVAGC